ncbi:DUF7503 family protein [Halorussus lipolyticus]|nr:hypothetical protein [Halorussus sp. DT80]
MTQNETLERIAQHPRLVGFLFTMSLALAHAGSAAANGASMTPGP